MSSSRTLPRLIIILACALAGMGACVLFQARRIAGRPQEFRSLAKLVAGGQLTLNRSIGWKEQQADFYGTITETLESAEMKRRALERVKALNPNLKPCDVGVRAVQVKQTTLFTILGSGSEPQFTTIFLNALLDEFIAFRQQIRELSQGKIFKQFLQEVTVKQKLMEEALGRMQQARSKVDSLEAKAEQERRAARLIRLRDQRDDLRLQIKALASDAADRSLLAAKMGPIEEEIHTIEIDLKNYDAAVVEQEAADQRYQVAKQAYEKMLEKIEAINLAYESSADYVVIQERATPASEHIEDWVQPVVDGGVAGWLLGGLLGLVLSLIILRKPSPPQIPTAI